MQEIKFVGKMKLVLVSGYLTSNDSFAVLRKALRKNLIYSQKFH